MPGARVRSGDRVTLRTVEREDVEFLQRAFANPEVRHPIGNPVRNREAIDVSDEDRGSDTFVVCLDDESASDPDGGSEPDPGRDDAGGDPDESQVRRIGTLHVNDADYKRPEIGYWLVPEVHGQGYGTEAVSLLLDYVFREYDTPAVGAEAFDFNDASRGLLKSLGFSEEGRRRKFMFVDGAHRDMVQYGILREEWRERE